MLPGIQRVLAPCYVQMHLSCQAPVSATESSYIFVLALRCFAAAKIHYGTSLSNVDYLHGGAESLLTITNLLIVVGLRTAIREEEERKSECEETLDKDPVD